MVTDSEKGIVTALEEVKEKKLLMGNHAVVYGLLKAGVGFVASYPGTPSTEAQMLAYKFSKEGKFYFEFAVNEKVAVEMAGAAALSGVRAAAIMKHVGMNVASDAFMALAYFGVKAGLVIIAVDDPGCLSSQNEQDTRMWGKFAHIPIFEPSNGQEIIETISKAYEFSERYNLLCIVRLTNYTSLNTTEVKIDKLPEKNAWNGEFIQDIRYALPARYVYHRELHNSLEKIKKDEEFQNFVKLTYENEKSDKVIVTHGAIYPIVEYMREKYKLDIPILKFNAIHPINEERIIAILKSYKYAYFIEELEPYLEDEISRIIGKHGLNIKILGKKELAVPYENRIIPDVLEETFKRIKADPENKEVFEKVLPTPPPFPKLFEMEEVLIPRTLPRLCDGCPHRGAFYSIKKATGVDAIRPSDIGCYALGQAPPVEVGDFWLCMGGSIGTALGFSITNKKPVVAVIGDGTFFHAGIPPLVDAVLYNHKITVAILNNHLTAMTGGQPTPSTPKELEEGNNPIDIEKVVRAIGVKYVRSVDVKNMKENVKIFKEAMAFDGPAVVIFNGDCVIEKFRRNLIPEAVPYVDQDTCIKCGNCLIDFSCPSILKENGKIVINPASCTSCMLCAEVCPTGAIKMPKARIKDGMRRLMG